MRTHWMVRLAIGLPVVVAVLFGQAQLSSAAPVVVTLTQETILAPVTDAGGSSTYDGGTVTQNNVLVGRYARTLRTVTGGTTPLNVSIVSITIFTLSGDPPASLTLQGLHNNATGRESGSVSAASLAGVTGILWSLTPATSVINTLTINFP